MTKDIEALYQEAKTALAAKEFDNAADLLRQILLQDHDYRDASRLLAQTIRLKRRRWYNDPRIWGFVGVLAMAALLVWALPRLQIPNSTLAEPVEASPTLAIESMITLPPTIAPSPTVPSMPSPTQVPLAWKRISTGQEFSRDTITAIVVDPKDRDIIYVGMQNAGIYKSIDGGLSWSPVQEGLDNAQVNTMLIDPQDPQILLAGTLGGMYKTTNGGENWRRIHGSNTRFLLMDPVNSSHLYMSGGWGLHTSYDQGETWEEIYSVSDCGLGIEDIKIDPRNGNKLVKTRYGGAWPCVGGVFRSLDGGHTWDRLGLGSANAVAIEQDAKQNTVYFVCGDTLDPNPSFPGKGLHFTNNDGKSWNFRKINCDLLLTSLDAPSKVYIGGAQAGLSISNLNGGITNLSLTNEMVTAIHVDEYNGQERIIVGVEKNGLYISQNGGISWNHQLGGIGTAYVGLKHHAGLGEKIFASTQYNATSCALFRSDDSGRNWKTVLDIGTSIDGRRKSLCNPAIDAEHALYTIQDLALAQSKDDGESWSFLPIPQIFDPINVNRWVSASPYGPVLIYYMPTSREPYMYYSDDFGGSWQSSAGLNPTYPEAGSINALFFADQGQTIYGEGIRSTDGGKTWLKCSGTDNRRNPNSDSFLAIDPQNSNRLLLATSGRGIWASSNGCGSWERSSTGISSQFANTVVSDPTSPGRYFAGTDSGAYVSFDGGANWQEINDGLLGATVVYSIVADDEGNVYASTPYGIFKLESRQ